MIFLENNRAKMFFMVLLVVIFFSAIFWQWWDYNPFKRVDTGQTSQMWTDILDEGAKTFEAVGANVEAGVDQASEISEEFVRQQKQQELLNATQEYLANQATSTDETDTSNQVE